MTQDEKKQLAATAAVALVEPDSVIGIGTGSTANFFIEALAAKRGLIEGAVASSEATALRLKSHRIQVFDLNATGELALYVDGADEATEHRQLI